MAELRKLIDADIAIKRFAELKFKGEMQDYDDEIRMVFESVIETTPTVTEAEIRAKALDEAKLQFRKEYANLCNLGIDTCVNLADYFDRIAEQLKAGE